MAQQKKIRESSLACCPIYGYKAKKDLFQELSHADKHIKLIRASGEAVIAFIKDY